MTPRVNGMEGDEAGVPSGMDGATRTGPAFPSAVLVYRWAVTGVPPFKTGVGRCLPPTPTPHGAGSGR